MSGGITIDNASCVLPGGQTQLRIPHYVQETGAQVALLGRSGSGKSTLLNLVSGLLPATEGSIIASGRELVGLPEARRDVYRRELVGMVYQSYQLLDDFSVRENVEMGQTFSAHGRAADTSEQAELLLEQVGLSGYAARMPRELSVGQRQRVAIARALIKQPSLLLADEPTGALDHETGAQICDLIQNLAHESACTVVFVTHDRTLASRFTQQVEVADLIKWQPEGGKHA